MNRRLIPFVLAAGVIVASPAFADRGTVADEVRLFDWVRTFWPIVVVFAGMIVAAVMAGLSMRFVSASAFSGLRDRVDRIEGECAKREIRVLALEKALDSPPTRQELQEDISELSERMKGVEVGIEAIHGVSKTTNSYLHTLLERGLRGAA